MIYNDPSTKDNADNLIKAVAAVTPAMVAESMKRIEADPAHSFVSASVKDTDTFETLNQRLLDLATLKGIDEEKKKGDTTNKTLCEIKDIIKEQQEITNNLLHRGNTLQVTANQAADRRQPIGDR